MLTQVTDGYCFSVEVQALQANVSEAQAKLDRLEEKNKEIDTQKEGLLTAIAHGEEVVQRQTESTSSEVIRLKGLFLFLSTFLIASLTLETQTNSRRSKTSTFGKRRNSRQTSKSSSMPLASSSPSPATDTNPTYPKSASNARKPPSSESVTSSQS